MRGARAIASYGVALFCVVLGLDGCEAVLGLNAETDRSGDAATGEGDDSGDDGGNGGSSSSTGGGGPTDGAGSTRDAHSGSGSGSGSSSGGGSGASSSSGSSSGGPPTSCVDAPGDAGEAEDCEDCCDNAPPDDSSGNNTGYDTFVNALLACGCGTTAAPGPCGSECLSNICANPSTDPTQACLTCLNGPAQDADDAGGCATQINTACMADPSCVAWNTCVDTCPGSGSSSGSSGSSSGSSSSGSGSSGSSGGSSGAPVVDGGHQ
jgi:hypothetical protein